MNTVLTKYISGIWQELLFVVEEYAEKYGRVNVVVGPIFDYNADGHADKLNDIEMYSFFQAVIFPHAPHILTTGDMSHAMNTNTVTSNLTVHSLFPRFSIRH